ncbi:NAD-dependent epimerase/dehydratase family protein [Streptomyces rubellomurinus]|uniref:NAD-dependent epimerase/dehydratase family protein n=1 Tax=Streptomyces rubellomurinus (strain ATCC 31215) TaxID=359131 RepID=UPI00099CA3EC|nr:NAD-dependent epimerase/dehydratase family protein [Streptomyces rubellomurinus]
MSRPHASDPGGTAATSAFAHRTAVVTGAAGFIGSHLCERLLDLGAEVVGVDNLLTGHLDNLSGLRSAGRFSFQTDDVSQPFGVSGPVDFVFHLASPASPLDYARHPLATLKVGAMGTLNALELAEAKQSRFLLASTSEVYGDPLVHPQPEHYWGNVNPVGPRSVYDEAKRYAEALAACFQRSGNARTRIVRIFNTYGPRMRADDGRAVPTFMQQALTGEPITVAGDGGQTRSLCFVADTVEGLLAAATADHADPVNLGNPHEITMLQLAEEIRALARSSSAITFVPLPADDPKRRCPDIASALAHLGWEPTTHLRDGLRRTLGWAEQHFPRQATATTGRGVS